MTLKTNAINPTVTDPFNENISGNIRGRWNEAVPPFIIPNIPAVLEQGTPFSSQSRSCSAFNLQPQQFLQGATIKASESPLLQPTELNSLENAFNAGTEEISARSPLITEQSEVPENNANHTDSGIKILDRWILCYPVSSGPELPNQSPTPSKATIPENDSEKEFNELLTHFLLLESKRPNQSPTPSEATIPENDSEKESQQPKKTTQPPAVITEEKMSFLGKIQFTLLQSVFVLLSKI